MGLFLDIYFKDERLYSDTLWAVGQVRAPLSPLAAQLWHFIAWLRLNVAYYRLSALPQLQTHSAAAPFFKENNTYAHLCR